MSKRWKQILQDRIKLLSETFKKMKSVYALTVLKSEIKDLSENAHKYDENGSLRDVMTKIECLYLDVRNKLREIKSREKFENYYSTDNEESDGCGHSSGSSSSESSSEDDSSDEDSDSGSESDDGGSASGRSQKISFADSVKWQSALQLWYGAKKAQEAESEYRTSPRAVFARGAPMAQEYGAQYEDASSNAKTDKWSDESIASHGHSDRGKVVVKYNIDSPSWYNPTTDFAEGAPQAALEITTAVIAETIALKDVLYKTAELKEFLVAETTESKEFPVAETAEMKDTPVAQSVENGLSHRTFENRMEEPMYRAKMLEPEMKNAQRSDPVQPVLDTGQTRQDTALDRLHITEVDFSTWGQEDYYLYYQTEFDEINNDNPLFVSAIEAVIVEEEEIRNYISETYSNITVMKTADATEQEQINSDSVSQTVCSDFVDLPGLTEESTIENAPSNDKISLPKDNPEEVDVVPLVGQGIDADGALVVDVADVGDTPDGAMYGSGGSPSEFLGGSSKMENKFLS